MGCPVRNLENMSKPQDPDLPPQGQFLVYRAEDGKVQIDVRLENESVWLTQNQMAELLDHPAKYQPPCPKHLSGGGIATQATHKESLSVRQEGSRQVKRQVDLYNLDAIISVGYRVKSAVATR